MATGYSAKQQWASLNKHFFWNTSLFVDFYWKYMLINENFGSGENLLDKWKHLLGKYISTCPGGQPNWKTNSGLG